VIAFLDADTSGRRLKGLLNEWGVADSQIVDLAAVIQNRAGDFELDDILSTPFYQSAVVAAYPDHTVEPPALSFKRPHVCRGDALESLLKSIAGMRAQFDVLFR
jgi:hypothetical protein